MWSNKAWAKHSDIISEIEKCDFVRELASGTLSFERFIFYIEQDNIYLKNFSERLQLLHSQLDDEKTKEFILQNIESTLALEIGLHAYIEETFNAKFDANAALSPANKAYILETAKIREANNPALTFASLLPCFWVYAYIGKSIYDNTIADNPFSPWITTYGDEAFINEAETFRALCDEHAGKCDAAIKEEMDKIFAIFTTLELQFWNDSYKGTF